MLVLLVTDADSDGVVGPTPADDVPEAHVTADDVEAREAESLCSREQLAAPAAPLTAWTQAESKE